jgi:hypothetical protein
MNNIYKGFATPSNIYYAQKLGKVWSTPVIVGHTSDNGFRPRIVCDTKGKRYITWFDPGPNYAGKIDLADSHNYNIWCAIGEINKQFAKPVNVFDHTGAFALAVAVDHADRVVIVCSNFYHQGDTWDPINYLWSGSICAKVLSSAGNNFSQITDLVVSHLHEYYDLDAAISNDKLIVIFTEGSQIKMTSLSLDS